MSEMSADIFVDVRRCHCDVLDIWRIVTGMALTAPQLTSPDIVGAGRRGLTRAEVMTVSEVAELLHLPVSTVYYLARRGEIPACRLGRAWRFLRPRIEEMLAS
jgi:excisionase family DNA binding protein